MTEKPTPVLMPGTVYVAHDRYVCDDVSCAGMSALFTGWTIGGAPVSRVTLADVRDWYGYDGGSLGALSCECGRWIVTPDGQTVLSAGLRIGEHVHRPTRPGVRRPACDPDSHPSQYPQPTTDAPDCPACLAGHVWQTARMTGNRTCNRCGLLPLDDDDIADPCPGEKPANR
jgi:hypothetical protein